MRKPVYIPVSSVRIISVNMVALKLYTNLSFVNIAKYSARNGVWNNSELKSNFAYSFVQEIEFCAFCEGAYHYNVTDSLAED